MNKLKLKYWLDFLPLLMLICYAAILVIDLSVRPFAIHWKHIVGLAVLPINAWYLFSKKHKLGIVVLGFTLVFGMIGLLSYDINITTSTISIGKTSNLVIPIFYGQPIFIFFLLIHFIVSGKYYFGVLTKVYWEDLLS